MWELRQQSGSFGLVLGSTPVTNGGFAEPTQGPWRMVEKLAPGRLGCLAGVAVTPGPIATSRRKAGLSDRAALAAVTGLACLGLPFVPRVMRQGLEALPLGREVERIVDRLLPLAVPPLISLSQVLTLVGLFFVLGLGLRRFGSSRLELTRVLAGVMACIALGYVGVVLARVLHLPPEVFPVSLAGLWVAASFGTGPGLLVSLVSACLPWLLLDQLSEFVALRALLGVVLAKDGPRPGSGALACLGAGVASSLVCLLSGSSAVGTALWILLGGLVETVFFLTGRASVERLLGHVSRERLHALLDLNQPLLRRMMLRAPGSFEHSRAMANLAEQAASAIGADALLTRVGAYYHDLGKSVDSRYFVENLEPGELSPHESLSPLESAEKIKAHVALGVEILRAGGIPEPVVEFSYTHHGTQRVEYFLNKQRQLCELSGEEVDEAAFVYPGMKPMTRETAILMLVDSIEAASRTLDSPDPSAIEEMVRRIVFSKLKAGQLDDAGLSMQDLRVACDRVAWTLSAMNHHRIKYPWQEQKPAQASRPEGALRVLPGEVPAQREEPSQTRPLGALAGPVPLEGNRLERLMNVRRSPARRSS